MQKFNFKFLTITFLLTSLFIFNACNAANTAGNGGGGGGNTPDLNETAATVNNEAIRLEEVERVLKQQAQGQEGRLSPLELAAARLQVLQTLIEQEALYQRAQKENTVPTDEEVTAEYNKARTQSGLSAEKFEEEMKKAGQTEASAREAIKKQLAIQRLLEKVTGKIEPPKDSEIEAFFNSNREAFKNKRGAQLAAIVIDPQNSGEGDTTKNEIEAQQKAKEIGSLLLSGRADFATVARENSEEQQTKLQGGDWRYFTEDEMKQAFGAGFADYVMNKMQNGQVVPQAIPFEGKILIVKLQRKQETDEERTLETPGVRQEITDYLINSRKQLLRESYRATVMNEAQIVNYLAQKVVTNPNELSGARPAVAATPANDANSNVNAVNLNANAANTNSSTNANAANKANANTSANANANR